MKKYLLLLLLASNSYGAQLPADKQVEVLDDFSNGWVTVVTPNKESKDSSPNMRNVFVDETITSIEQRRGWGVVGNCPYISKGSLFATLIKADGTRRYVVGDSSSVWSTPDFQTWTLVRGGLNTTANIEWVQYKDKLWFTNGVDAPFTWDNSTTVVLDGGFYGTTRYPNAPKGQHICLYKNRIFLYNTPTNDSALHFSELTSTAGVAINPDHELAWPAINQLNIGSGDGTQGTAVFVFKSALYAAKEASIYLIGGTGVTTYSPSKCNAETGVVSKESIVFLDNNAYIHSQDGFYAFDGQNSQRLSDAFSDEIQNIYADATRNLQNVWDTNAQFLTGSVSGSTITAGSVRVFDQINILGTPRMEDATGDDFSNLFFKNGNLGVSPNFSTSTINYFGLWNAGVDAHSFYKGNVSSQPNYVGFISTIGIAISENASRNLSSGAVTITFRKTNTGESSSVTFTTANATGYGLMYVSTLSPVLQVSIDEINFGSITYKIDITTAGDGWWIAVSSIGGAYSGLGSADLKLFNTTGQYISQVTTNSLLTLYGLFESSHQVNSGAIDYFYRSATSAVNITTYPWISILPSQYVSASVSDKYFQWAASMTLKTINNNSNISYVSLSRVEGSGPVTRSFGTARNNRWWLAVSTEATGNFPLIYVKAKGTSKNPLAFVPFDSIPVRSYMNVNDDTFYAGHSTCGFIMRVDYGTSDNGAPISAYYETPDLVLGTGETLKSLWELWVDADKGTGASLRIGTSINSSAFRYNTLDLSGTGRSYGIIRNPNAGVVTMGNQFRFRFENTTLDKTMAVHKFTIIYRPTLIR